jgi:hypothetical protein
VPGSDVFALGMAGSVPPASMNVGGREVLDAPALPLPNPTPSARAALLEVEVEKSIQMGMAILEQLPWFGPDPTLKGAPPLESGAPPPPMAEASGLTARAGAGTEAQEVAKEATPKGPSAQVWSTTGGRL